MSLLIASSSHQCLKSLIPLHIDPLLKGLYLNGSSTGEYSLFSFKFNSESSHFGLTLRSFLIESYLDLGIAWMHVGGLRFKLLLGCDSLDPAKKYSWKLSHLEEKIVSSKLEMKVGILIYL